MLGNCQVTPLTHWPFAGTAGAFLDCKSIRKEAKTCTCLILSNSPPSLTSPILRFCVARHLQEVFSCFILSHFRNLSPVDTQRRSRLASAFSLVFSPYFSDYSTKISGSNQVSWRDSRNHSGPKSCVARPCSIFCCSFYLHGVYGFLSSCLPGHVPSHGPEE
jgi:hypothetical protein